MKGRLLFCTGLSRSNNRYFCFYLFEFYISLNFTFLFRIFWSLMMRCIFTVLKSFLRSSFMALFSTTDVSRFLLSLSTIRCYCGINIEERFYNYLELTKGNYNFGIRILYYLSLFNLYFSFLTYIL